MKIEKFKRLATLLTSTGGKLEVNLFLRYFTEIRSGPEHLVDVLNSDGTFVPMEDVLGDEILLIAKNQIMGLELSERDLMPETLGAPSVSVRVELINGEALEGSFFIEMPEDRSRLSDFLNYTPQFIYLCHDHNDFILNKTYILTIKQR
jgi:hypothetical protein